MTRTEFEDMCKDLLKRVAGPVEEALRSAAMRVVSMVNTCCVCVI